MRLADRFLTPMVVAAVVATLALAWISGVSRRIEARHQAVDELSRQAALLAASAHLLPREAMQAYAIRASTSLGARLTLIASGGEVVADSAIDPGAIPQMDNHLGRPEIEQARVRGSGVSRRLSTTTRIRYWYVAHRVDVPAAVGFVRLAVPTSDLRVGPWSAGWPVVAGAIASMLMLIAIAGTLAGRMSRFIDELSATLEDATLEDATPGPAATAPVHGRTPSIERLSAAVKRSRAATLDRIAELDSKGAILAPVIATMKEGLLVVGADRRIQLTNRAMREVLGLPFDPTGRLVAEVVRHPAVMQDLEAALEEQRETRDSIVTFETSGRSFELQITPMRAREDESLRLLVLFFDVTRLQALDGIRREFVGNVSHELRTPLTSINAFVETLLEGELDDPAATRRFLEIVRKHATRMNALLDDLTDLSAIETGAVRLDLQELDVRAVVREVVEQLRPLAETRQIQIRSEIAAALPLKADRGRLEQVLTNLIHNAIKFNRPGGTVTVRGAGDGDRIRLAVEDTGVGIPAGSQEKIFNRFYQLDKARSREHGGTGLGLAIVKHLMRLHGGTVRVDSELGSGATFTLDFPQG